MINTHFAMALRSRLFMTHDNIPHNLRCSCHQKAPIDPYGIHLQKCKSCYHLTTDTHDALKLIHAELARTCGYTCHVEPLGVYRADDPTNGNRLDLLIVCPDQDTGLIGIDHRVTNPINADIEHRRTPHTPTAGQNIRKSESEKTIKHNTHCTKQNITFYPAINDSYGAWGSIFKKLFNKWIHKLSQITNTHANILYTHWSQRISVALQTHVARAQLVRLGHLKAINTPMPPPDPTPHSIRIQQTWHSTTHYDFDTHAT